MNALRIIRIGLLAGAFVAGSASAETVKLVANLQPSSEVPPTISDGIGSLDATLNTITGELKWSATYKNLTGTAVAAHFHGPAPAGQNAAVLVPIAKNALASPIEGSTMLDASQMSQVMSGKWYFNVHTPKYPDGEIRGQLKHAG
ncbi:CHRD domain-containing protein [Burkholderia sp. Nafp2/4-1b]|uniref:CHRD domain-containing protein n=1 Tax=Burkholderia sp. Nafp2/4-1b TaxID=2116686 RepID=UPI000EF909FD|nr:CHRD domain-containing protein [Burkholderia sp. Nafp2/4-1b]RKT98625.1 CHRD domain-containing protein [Burkholderia sp. Nafp2/4-1b]